MHIKNVMIGVTVLPKRKKQYREGIGDEEVYMGKILVTQVCHWKEWEILDEIDIKIMVIGCIELKW
jgi:hypothetical protein